MADMSADAEALHRALVELDALLAAGRTVYVHCLGGFGRTGMAVGSYLVEKGLVPPKEVLALIRILRAETDAPATESPQTAAQCRLVTLCKPGPFSLPLQ